MTTNTKSTKAVSIEERIATMSFMGHKQVDDCRALIKATYKDKDAAMQYLAPAYATSYGATCATLTSGAFDWSAKSLNTPNGKVTNKAYMKLYRDVKAAFEGKPVKEENNKKFDAEKYATQFVAKHTVAQTLRLIEALKAAIK